MKLQGIVGTGSGKLGSSVFVVRHGEQIVRAYQPVVSDAKSAKQLKVRAIMKLMVQLGAILGPGIGFRRIGNISPRNRFFTANFHKAVFNNGVATIDPSVLDISGGTLGLTTPSVTRDGGVVNMSLLQPEPAIDGVVYVLVEHFSGSSFVRAVVTSTDKDNNFSAVANMEGTRDGYVLAYGFRFVDRAAYVAFSSIAFETPAYAVSYLRSLYEDALVTTITRYVVVPAIA